MAHSAEGPFDILNLHRIQSRDKAAHFIQRERLIRNNRGRTSFLFPFVTSLRNCPTTSTTATTSPSLDRLDKKDGSIAIRF